MLQSCYHNAGQNHDIRVTNGSLEYVVQFIHLGTTVTNPNLREKLRGDWILVMLATFSPEPFIFLYTV
jgi:hypothetical protein